MKKLAVIGILVIVGFGCGSKNDHLKGIENGPAKAHSKNETIHYDRVSTFSHDDDGIFYWSNKFRLQLDPISNRFDLFQSGKRVGEIRLDSMHYEGPGFAIYLYESYNSADKLKFLVFEAMADIGTSWYCVTTLSNSEIGDSFIIREPTGNNDETPLHRFMFMALSGNELELNFNKEYIKYETLPEGFEEETDFIHTKKTIKL